MYRKYPKKPRSNAVWHWEEILLLLFFIVLPMQNMGIILGGLSFAALLMFLTLLYTLARMVLRKDSWFLLLPFRNRMSVAILALLFVSILSIVNAVGLKYYVQINARTLILYLLVLLIAVIIKTNKRTFYALLLVLVLGSIPNTLAGIYEITTKKMILKGAMQGTEEQQEQKSAMGGGPTTQLPGEKGGRRIGGFDGGAGDHAIHFVVYAGISTFFLFSLKNPWLRLFTLLLVFLQIVNVVGTASRTGLIGLGVAIMVFVYVVPVGLRQKAAMVAVLIVGMILAPIVFDLPLKRLFGQTASTKGTEGFRIQQYQTAWNMFKKYPILGVGAGCYVTEYRRFHFNYPAHEKSYVAAPLHNAFLNQAAETGLVGLGILLYILWTVVYELRRILHRALDPELRFAAASLLTAFFGWCSGLLFYPSLIDEQGWILIGLTIALGNIIRRSQVEISERKASVGLPA